MNWFDNAEFWSLFYEWMFPEEAFHKARLARPARAHFPVTSLIQLNAADTLGKPTVLVSRMAACSISALVAPAALARLAWL